MNEGASRELSLDEIDDLSMQAIDQITPRLPVGEYRTSQADDGSSGHIMEFGPGARFEVIYDREGRPVDYRADRVRFELLAGHNRRQRCIITTARLTLNMPCCPKFACTDQRAMGRSSSIL